MTGSGAERMLDKSAFAKINAPVHGFYAQNDARINETLPKTIEAMTELKRTFEPVTYEGAGHGFMRGRCARTSCSSYGRVKRKPTTRRWLITKKL